ncbi:MAG: hypothetical protein KGK07_14795 [Chloroflexota bacterium]|nr:hypothetical protein [Chloroflexota bacterium]
MRRLYLITTIPQLDGSVRRVYSLSRADAAAAREDLRRDPALVAVLSRLYSSLVIREERP